MGKTRLYCHNKESVQALRKYYKKIISAAYRLRPDAKGWEINIPLSNQLETLGLNISETLDYKSA